MTANIPMTNANASSIGFTMEQRSLITDKSMDPSTRTRLSQVDSWNRRGTVLVKEGHFEEAIVLFDRALDLNPHSDVAWLGRGDALANLKRYQEALSNFDRAVQLNPGNYAAWTFRGVVLLHLERAEEALTSCDRALAIQPHDLEAWTFRGAALQRLGRYHDAYDSFERATGKQRASIWQGIGKLLKGLFSDSQHRHRDQFSQKLD